MIRYSKPLGNLLSFKQEFFKSNDLKLEEFQKLAEIYRSQPYRHACKNCDRKLEWVASGVFVKLGVEYGFCPHCGHCNGRHEDTEEFCRALYTDSKGADYARGYAAIDAAEYDRRVAEIYLPKARFLKEALAEQGLNRPTLADFGAGAGYFVKAALDTGFEKAQGFEPSETLASLGNAMIKGERITKTGLNDIDQVIRGSNDPVASFIGVLEHLQKPREALGAIRENRHIEYLFFSVPLFSPTVAIESVFPDVMPRHLAAGHTHLYTERSIQYFCDEFGFQRESEWWFGLDICDLSRSVIVSLEKQGGKPLRSYWEERLVPLIDRLQQVLDEARACSEVHMLLKRKG